MHVVIGCGSRDWNDVFMTRQKLEIIENEVTGTEMLTVIEGGQRGADRLVGRWAAAARARGIGWVRFNADWDTHHPDWCPGAWCSSRRYCVGAGHRRNQQMLDWAMQAEHQSILAFKDGFDLGRGKGGTEDMVRRAQQTGVHGKVVSHVARPRLAG